MTTKTLKDFDDIEYPQWLIKQEAIKLVKLCRERIPMDVEGIERIFEGFKLDDATKRDILLLELGRIQALRHLCDITSENLL